MRTAALLHTALLLAMATGPALASAADPLDEALYASLLEDYTRETDDVAGTRVDYRGLRREPRWRRLVESLARAGPAAGAPERERIAFWLNAYNILAIDLVVNGYPVDEIRDLGSLFRPVWKRPAGRVTGRSVSLGEIEHEVLRPLGDPRVHAGIVCASLSCPALRREPWNAARLDAQLEDTLRRWLANPSKGLRVERADGRLRLSRIFDWFEDDFAPAGGVLAFVERYAPPEARDWLASRAGQVRVVYFDYDWSLNDLARAAPDG
jgi:hypothetical protein